MFFLFVLIIGCGSKPMDECFVPSSRKLPDLEIYELTQYEFEIIAPCVEDFFWDHGYDSYAIPHGSTDYQSTNSGSDLDINVYVSFPEDEFEAEDVLSWMIEHKSGFEDSIQKCRRLKSYNIVPRLIGSFEPNHVVLVKSVTEKEDLGVDISVIQENDRSEFEMKQVHLFHNMGFLDQFVRTLNILKVFMEENEPYYYEVDSFPVMFYHEFCPLWTIMAIEKENPEVLPETLSGLLSSGYMEDDSEIEEALDLIQTTLDDNLFETKDALQYVVDLVCQFQESPYPVISAYNYAFEEEFVQTLYNPRERYRMDILKEVYCEFLQNDLDNGCFDDI